MSDIDLFLYSLLFGAIVVALLFMFGIIKIRRGK